MVRAGNAAERLVEGVEVPVNRRGVPLSVRIPPELSKRIEKLEARLGKQGGVASLGIVNRTAVVKLILLRGCEAIEAELSGK